MIFSRAIGEKLKGFDINLLKIIFEKPKQKRKEKIK